MRGLEMVYSAKSDDTNIISQFTRLKYIHITTNGSSTPVNYQVKLTIDYEPEMQADFSDIRFNTLGNIYIDYWIESKTDSVIATVWIELPDAITDPGSDTIWMCYGNSGLSGESSISDTFLKGDDVENGSISDLTTTGGTWTAATDQKYQGSYSVKGVGGSAHKYAYYNDIISDDVVIEGWVRTSDGYVGLMWGWQDSNNYYYTQINVALGRLYIIKHISGSETSYYASNVSMSINTWYFMRIKWMSDGTQTVYIYDINMNLLGSKSMSENTYSSGKLGYHNYQTGWIDNFRVRKYIANEPTISYGTAQHQRSVPQFIG